MIVRTHIAAMLFVAMGTASAEPPAPLPQPKNVKAEPAGIDIHKMLATRVTLEKAYEGKFKDAVKMIGEKYDLPLVIDPRLGGEADGNACASPADDKSVSLPKMTNVRLGTLVKLLAEQVNGKFLAYPEYVKIVPAAYAEYESGSLRSYYTPGFTVTPGSEEEAPLLAQTDLIRTRPLIKRALVNVSFKNKPFSEVLDEIAESTGANVVASPLLPANVRQAPITVRFANTPVDVAVRTLCEMTESGVIEDANVLLVTTRERAAARAKEEAQKVKDAQASVPVNPLNFIPQNFDLNTLQALGLLGAAARQPDHAGEIAKLKEQNELLKKELEEIKKVLKK